MDKALIMSFIACPKDLFFTRNDGLDPRLGDLVSSANENMFGSSMRNETIEIELFKNLTSPYINNLNLNNNIYIMAGYPDDDGIRLNGGRPGARLGPDQVRRYLYRMTPGSIPFALAESKIQENTLQLFDLGNLSIGHESIHERQQSVQEFALTWLNQGGHWLSVGGGHDYGYPDAAAFIEWAKTHSQHKPLIINFDAHLDVRSDQNGISSGTPFYRMLEKHGDLDFLEVGIQRHCNSQHHLDWIFKKNARVIFMDDIIHSPEKLVTLVIEKIGDWLIHKRPVFLSVDIDAFSSAYAPGCSQSWATGLEPREFLQCLDLLKERLSVKALGIYEVSPLLDHDDRTSKLAAQIIHRILA